MYRVLFRSACLLAMVTACGSEDRLVDLRSGNERFASETSLADVDDQDHRVSLVDGQAPHTTVLTCSDSRVAPEIIFDSKLGELFVIRTAGNVVDGDAVASIEYSCAFLKTPVLLIMGHQNCGAVTSAFKEDKSAFSDNLQGLLAKIEPAVAQVKSSHPNVDKEEAIHLAIQENTRQVHQKILEMSPVIAGLVDDGSLEIQEAVYDMSSGQVVWLD